MNNKTKKIISAVVAMVMAGSMAVSLAACGPKKPDGGSTDNKLTPATDANGKLSYDAGQEVIFAAGHNNAQTGIAYDGTAATEANKNGGLMGTTASAGTLKPAWAAVESTLGIDILDRYPGVSASENISKIKENYNTEGGLAAVDILTASASAIIKESASGTLLNIADYLDYMPNLKAFLESSPVIQMSLIANNDGAMYMIPYFDGNDDIEKFVLMRKDLVETLLINGDVSLATTTFKAQADAKNAHDSKPADEIVGTQASAKSFMGTEGSWKIETTDPAVLSDTQAEVGNDADAVTSNATVEVTVSYDKALADAKATTAGSMGAILADAGIDAADIAAQKSGNIVDIMNLAINETQGAVKGTTLVNLLRRYIDVAYLGEDGNSFYTEANGLTRAGVFNSACAAWDADLYTALGRVFVTSGTMLGAEAADISLRYLVAGRAFTTQRTTDVSSLAGELYGARGLESRYNYTYINSKGEIADGRSEVGFWEALDKMHDLALEGLFNTANNISDKNLSTSEGTNVQALSMHDYVQTQTSAWGFEDGTDYNFAPILTSVSKWDTNDDGTAETIMRFTESWRGVKDGGLCIPQDAVADNPEKLAAVLTFVDYLYSTDGQIVMTYGPQSTNGNTNPNGLWYATEATNVTLDTVADASKTVNYSTKFPAQYTVKDEYAEDYFIFNGKVYTGTFYNGRQIPTMTNESKALFATQSHNFTNYARRLLGTTLPLGNKDQGFEYQCTSPCGRVGSNIVNVALNNGTVKHQFQTIDENNYWYTLSPTLLPYDTRTTNAIAAGNLALLSGQGADNNNMYVSTSKTSRNILLDIMYYGFDTSKTMDYVTISLESVGRGSKALPSSAEDAVKLNNDVGLEDLVGYKETAWDILLDWYEANA